MAVGGLNDRDETTAAVHKYNPSTDSWHLISNMPTARYGSLVAVLPTNEVMVVGGKTSQTISGITDRVEIVSILSDNILS